MKPGVTRLLVSLALLLPIAIPAYGQGGATSAISGVVKDSAGGVIPGASVVVTSNATGTKFEAVTNTTGAFNVPALSAGAYTVTVSLQGFKTAVITDVRVQPGIPTTVNATLEVGGVAETVTVTGASAELDQHADGRRSPRRSTSTRSRRSRRRRATCCSTRSRIWSASTRRASRAATPRSTACRSRS